VILAKATRSTQHWQSSVPSSVLVSLIPPRPLKKERRERTVPPVASTIRRKDDSINLVA
jgi:hypothetical protein